jgi:hypothetical protein
MAIYFVDGATGDDTNDGLDQAGAALATATWTAATRTLTQVAHGYTFVASDVIRIKSGTGATVGNYEVESATADTIVLKATTTLPGVSAGTALAAGNLTDEDITSATGPFVTIQKAADTVAAGDTVWVKASATYNERVIGAITGGVDDPIAFIGYGSALGDGVRAVIDAQSARLYCFDLNSAVLCEYYSVINFTCKNATSYGMWCNKSSFLQNILAHGNTNHGIFDNNSLNVFHLCETYSNSVIGIRVRSGTLALGCYAHDEVKGYNSAQGAIFMNSVADTCSTAGVTGNLQDKVVNCTFYSCDIGYDATSGYAIPVMNCIFHSCTTAVTSTAAARLMVLDNCVFHNNGTDVGASIAVPGRGSGNAAKGPGCISADPGFVDAPNGNFTPTADAVREAAAFTFLGTNVSGVSRTFLWPGAVQPKHPQRHIPSIGGVGRR